MTLQEIIVDLHTLREDVESYERKYGVLSETFFESYMNGEEPEDDAWLLDWADWAGAYKIWLRRQEQYRIAIEELRKQSNNLMNLIERTSRHESISVTS